MQEVSKKPFNIETNTLALCLGAGLLQVGDGMNCPKDTTPDNTILCSIAFSSKSISKTMIHYSNIER